MKVLHILNGDGMLGALPAAGIAGEELPWREALSSGPVHPEVGSRAFIRIRSEWLGKTFQQSAQTQVSWAENAFERMRTWQQFEEYVLWFGQDYFCQVNLLAVLSWFFTEVPPAFPVSLVSVDQLSGYGPVSCLGSLSPEQLATLFPNRIRLQENDLKAAHIVWQAYCAKDARVFNKLLSDLPPTQLPFLPDTVARHQARFPHLTDGLSALERMSLQLLQQKGHATPREHIKSMLLADFDYGFGDLQMELVVAELRELIQPSGTALNRTGEAVLHGKISVKRQPASVWIGGALRDAFQWNAQELVAVSS